MTKIPLIALVYKNIELVKEFANNIVQNPNLEITIVENGSTSTPELGLFFKKLLDSDEIYQYIQFEKNISNNAMAIIFEDDLIDLSSEYIVVTDGDLIPDEGWLEEHLNILKNNSDVFVVGNTLKEFNLPLTTFPESVGWAHIDLAPESCYTDYVESMTGGHLWTFRTKEFNQFLTWMFENNKKYIDDNVHHFGRNILGKKSARTKETSSTHLTWTLYQDLNHPYTTERLENKTVWNHEESSEYVIYTKEDNLIV